MQWQDDAVRQCALGYSKDAFGIIHGGGGPWGACGAGVTTVLGELGVLSRSKTAFAASAGIANLGFGLSGNPRSGIEIYFDWVPGNLGALCFNIPPVRANIPGLVEHFFNRSDPLNIENICKQNTELFAALTRCDTGEMELFSVREHRPVAPQLFHASMAVPILAKPVKVHENFYCDGGARLTWPIEEMVGMGIKNILIISNWPLHKQEVISKIESRVLRFFLRNHPRLRDACLERYNRNNAVFSELVPQLVEGGINFGVIAPSLNLSKSILSTERETMLKLAQHGMDQALRWLGLPLDALPRFLKETY